MVEGGDEALLDADRKKPNFGNRIEQSIESVVVAFAIEQPAFSQVRINNKLRKRGVFVSASGVRSVWLRHDLESFKKACLYSRSMWLSRARCRLRLVSSKTNWDLKMSGVAARKN